MTSPSDTPKPAAPAAPHVDDLNDPILKAMANPEPGQCDYCLERDGKHALGCDALRDGETTGFIADETRPAQATGVGEPFDWKAAWYALDQDNAALSTRALAAEAVLASSAAETARLREERDEAVKLLEQAKDWLHNPFEPDNQSMSYKAISTFLATRHR